MRSFNLLHQWSFQVFLSPGPTFYNVFILETVQCFQEFKSHGFWFWRDSWSAKAGFSQLSPHKQAQSEMSAIQVLHKWRWLGLHVCIQNEICQIKTVSLNFPFNEALNMIHVSLLCFAINVLFFFFLLSLFLPWEWEREIQRQHPDRWLTAIWPQPQPAWIRGFSLAESPSTQGCL